jgi:hypothetical protein
MGGEGDDFCKCLWKGEGYGLRRARVLDKIGQ